MDLFLRNLMDAPRFIAPFSGGDTPVVVPVVDQSRPPNTYKWIEKTNHNTEFTKCGLTGTK